MREKSKLGERKTKIYISYKNIYRLWFNKREVQKILRERAGERKEEKEGK